MTVFEVVVYVVALALAASKQLEALKPFWTKLPSPVATFLPSVVVALGLVVQYLGAVESTVPALASAGVALALALVDRFGKHRAAA